MAYENETLRENSLENDEKIEDGAWNLQTILEMSENSSSTDFINNFQEYLQSLRNNSHSYRFDFRKFFKCTNHELKTSVHLLINNVFTDLSRIQVYRNIYKQIYLNSIKIHPNPKTLIDILDVITQREVKKITNNQNWNEIVIFGIFLAEIYKVQTVPISIVENWIVFLLPSVNDGNIKAEIAFLLLLQRISNETKFTSTKSWKRYLAIIKKMSRYNEERRESVEEEASYQSQRVSESWANPAPDNFDRIEIEEDAEHEEILAQVAITSTICRSFQASLDGSIKFDNNKFEYMTLDEIEVCVRMMIDKIIFDSKYINRSATVVFHYQNILTSLRSFANNVIKECMKEIETFEKQDFKTMERWHFLNYAHFFGELYMLDKAIFGTRDMINWIKTLLKINNDNSIDALITTMKLCGRKLKIDDELNFDQYFNYAKSNATSSLHKQIIGEIEEQILDDENNGTILDLLAWTEQQQEPSTSYQRIITDFRSFLRLLNRNDRNAKFDYMFLLDQNYGSRKMDARAMSKNLLDRNANALGLAKFLKAIYMLSFSFGNFIKILKRTLSMKVTKIKKNWNNLILRNDEATIRNNENFKFLKNIGIFIAQLTNLFVIDKGNLNELLATLMSFDPATNAAILETVLNILNVALLGMQTSNRKGFETNLALLEKWNGKHTALQDKIRKIKDKYKDIEIPKNFIETIFKAKKCHTGYSTKITEFDKCENSSELAEIYFLNAISHPLMSEYFAKFLSVAFEKSSITSCFKRSIISLCQRYFEHLFYEDNLHKIDDIDKEDALGTIQFIAQLTVHKVLSEKICLTVLEKFENNIKNSKVAQEALKILIDITKNQIERNEFKYRLKEIGEKLKTIEMKESLTQIQTPQITNVVSNNIFDKATNMRVKVKFLQIVSSHPTIASNVTRTSDPYYDFANALFQMNSTTVLVDIAVKLSPLENLNDRKSLEKYAVITKDYLYRHPSNANKLWQLICLFEIVKKFSYGAKKILHEVRDSINADIYACHQIFNDQEFISKIEKFFFNHRNSFALFKTLKLKSTTALKEIEPSNLNSSVTNNQDPQPPTSYSINAESTSSSSNSIGRELTPSTSKSSTPQLEITIRKIPNKYQLIASENAEFHRKFTTGEKTTVADETIVRFKEMLKLLNSDNANSLARTVTQNEFPQERLVSKYAFIMKEFLYQNPHLTNALKKFTLKMKSKSRLKMKIKEFVEYDVYDACTNEKTIDAQIIKGIKGYFNNNFNFLLWRNALEYVCSGYTNALIFLIKMINGSEKMINTRRKRKYIDEFLTVLKAYSDNTNEELERVIKSLESFRNVKPLASDVETDSEDESDQALEEKVTKIKNYNTTGIKDNTKIEMQQDTVAKQNLGAIHKRPLPQHSSPYDQFEMFLNQMTANNVYEIAAKIKPTLLTNDKNLLHYSRIIVDYGYKKPEMANTIKDLLHQLVDVPKFRFKQIKLKIEMCLEKDLIEIVEKKNFKSCKMENYCKFFIEMNNTIKDSFIFIQWRYLLSHVKADNKIALEILVKLMENNEHIMFKTSSRKNCSKNFIEEFNRQFLKPHSEDVKRRMAIILSRMSTPSIYNNSAQYRNVRVDNNSESDTSYTDNIKQQSEYSENNDDGSEYNDPISIHEFKEILNSLSSKSIETIETSAMNLQVSSQNEINEIAEFFYYKTMKSDDIHVYIAITKIIDQNTKITNSEISFQKAFVDIFILNFEKLCADYEKVRKTKENDVIKAENVNLHTQCTKNISKMSRFYGYLFNHGLIDFTQLVILLEQKWFKHANNASDVFEMIIIFNILEVSILKILKIIRNKVALHRSTDDPTDPKPFDESFYKLMNMYELLHELSMTDFFDHELYKVAPDVVIVSEVLNFFEAINNEIRGIFPPVAQNRVQIKEKVDPIEMLSSEDKFKHILDNLNEEILQSSVKQVLSINVNKAKIDFSEIVKIFIKKCEKDEENAKITMKLMKHVKAQSLDEDSNAFIEGFTQHIHNYFFTKLVLTDPDINEAFKIVYLICKVYHCNLINLNKVSMFIENFFSRGSDFPVSYDCIFTLLESIGADFKLNKPHLLENYMKFFREYYSIYGDCGVIGSISKDLIEMERNNWTLIRRVKMDIIDAFLCNNVSISTLKLRIIEDGIQPNEFIQTIWKNLMTNPQNAIDLSEALYDGLSLFDYTYLNYLSEFLELRRQAFLQIPKESYNRKIHEKLKFFIIFMLELYNLEIFTDNFDKWIHPRLIEKFDDANDKIEISRKLALLKFNFTDERSKMFMKNLDNSIADNQMMNFIGIKHELKELEKILAKESK